MNTAPQRFGHVVVLGEPNAGKSTLVNALVGQKVSIVSAKPQTTRTRITGIMQQGAAQIVLVDTPGLFSGDVGALGRPMRRNIRSGLDGVDVCLLLVDASVSAGRRREALARLRRFIADHRTTQPVLVILTKIGTQPKAVVLAQLVDLAAAYPEAASFHPLSARKGDGVGLLAETLAAAMPTQPWRFAADDISTLPLQLLAAECTREQLFARLHQEVPYGMTVVPVSWEQPPKCRPKVHQSILVTRESHKAMVIGKGGAMLKTIGTSARAAIGELSGGSVHLFLHVKVEPDWLANPDYGFM